MLLNFNTGGERVKKDLHLQFCMVSNSDVGKYTLGFFIDSTLDAGS